MYSTRPAATVAASMSPGCEQRRHAEVGVHRPLGVGRDDDDAPPGRQVGVGRAGPERDADGAQVVAEHRAELVVADLADVRRPPAERGDAAHRVGRRAAAHLDGAAERLVQVHRPLGLDQRHRPLDEVVLGDEAVVGMGDDVDQRVADADDVELRGRADVGHGARRYRPRRAICRTGLASIAVTAAASSAGNPYRLPRACRPVPLQADPATRSRRGVVRRHGRHRGRGQRAVEQIVLNATELDIARVTVDGEARPFRLDEATERLIIDAPPGRRHRPRRDRLHRHAQRQAARLVPQHVQGRRRHRAGHRHHPDAGHRLPPGVPVLRRAGLQGGRSTSR